jgi:hypothetical protein
MYVSIGIEFLVLPFFLILDFHPNFVNVCLCRNSVFIWSEDKVCLLIRLVLPFFNALCTMCQPQLICYWVFLLVVIKPS